MSQVYGKNVLFSLPLLYATISTCVLSLSLSLSLFKNKQEWKTILNSLSVANQRNNKHNNKNNKNRPN